MVEVGLRRGGTVSPGNVVGVVCALITTVLHILAQGGYQQKAAAEQVLVVLAGAVEKVTSSPLEDGLKGHGSKPVGAIEYRVSQLSPHWQYS
jgi:hypothetical protein